MNKHLRQDADKILLLPHFSRNQTQSVFDDCMQFNVKVISDMIQSLMASGSVTLNKSKCDAGVFSENILCAKMAYFCSSDGIFGT